MILPLQKSLTEPEWALELFKHVALCVCFIIDFIWDVGIEFFPLATTDWGKFSLDFNFYPFFCSVAISQLFKHASEDFFFLFGKFLVLFHLIFWIVGRDYWITELIKVLLRELLMAHFSEITERAEGKKSRLHVWPHQWRSNFLEK